MLTSLSPKQTASIRESTARINLWHGSVRSGKTVASQVRWIQRLRSGPDGDVAMIGKTSRTLKRNILVPLQRILGASRCTWREGMGEARILGRNVWLFGANDERSEQKIRGVTLSDAYGDEVTLWPQSFYAMLLSRLSVKGAGLFGTTNPDAPLHWLKRDFIDRAAELDLRHFPFTLEDNPYLDATYVASLKQEYTGLWRRRFIDGEWVLAEGAIWDAFNPAVHVVPGLPAGATITDAFVSVDYGTSNPFVALLMARVGDDQWYVLEEWRWDSRARGSQLTDEQYSERTREWAADSGREASRWYVDPSALSFKVQLQRDGIEVVDADNSVLDGLRTVATLFASGKLYITASCSGLIDEILSYVWDARACAKGEDAPLKQNDHGPDALRYGVFSAIQEPHGGLMAYYKHRSARGEEGAA